MLIDKIDQSKLTPMMKQYIEIKNQYRDLILFYRLGDFYEMFFDDALIAAKELELVLTGRDAGLDERVPMAGVPHHSSNPYIYRLVEKGYKIGIVEQLEDPATSKGIVKRNVVKIVSPGTILDLEGKEKDNNFLLALYGDKHSYGISYLDITTGEFKTTEILNSANIERDLLDFIVKINPKEIVLSEKLAFKNLVSYISQKNIYLTYVDLDSLDLKAYMAKINKKVKNFNKTFFANKYFSLVSISLLLDYIYSFREDKLDHIDDIEYINTEVFMKLDASTRENLEIHKNLNDNSRKNSLFHVLDLAETPMGSRKINSWLEFPLLDNDHINRRLDIVDFLYTKQDLSRNLDEILNQIYDIERLLSKISYKNANARDLLLLKNSIENLPKFKFILEGSNFKGFENLAKDFDTLEDLHNLIDQAIVENPPIQISEGGLIKAGYSEELDQLRSSSVRGKELMVEYEVDQKKKTGIPKLKISYNKNVGYYIEITNSYLDKVPEDYTRRQTLKNSERYITTYLNELSDMILGSQSEVEDLEYQLFNDIRQTISEASTRIKATTDTISTVDALNSFAKVALNNNYTRPIFNKENYISISEGRHPVVELSLGANAFIANDAVIGKNNKTFQVITGPNMAGKSTYMRQLALILLMAQIGSFVPAKAADISISDAIFTRIGASDNLAKGDSTFMVEMNEMSNIIKNAGENSFIILDEVGRGTGTNDGYSIAKSIVEYITKHNKSKTLFATHYHELTSLEDEIPTLENLKVEIEEKDGDIIFLRKIIRGKTDKSYGIEVAKLAGLPSEIIARAKHILENIDQRPDFTSDGQISMNLEESPKYNTLETEILLHEIKDIDINNITGIQALEKLESLMNKAKDIYND